MRAVRNSEFSSSAFWRLAESATMAAAVAAAVGFSGAVGGQQRAVPRVPVGNCGNHWLRLGTGRECGLRVCEPGLQVGTELALGMELAPHDHRYGS